MVVKVKGNKVVIKVVYVSRSDRIILVKSDKTWGEMELVLNEGFFFATIGNNPI